MTPRPRTSATAVATRLAIVVLAATLLVACSSDDDESADDSTTTSTTAPAAGDDDGTSTTAAMGAEPGPSSSTTPPALKPPDKDSPVAGMCGEATGDVVEISFTADLMPSPRCVKVTADQQLFIRNDTDQPEDVSFAHFAVTLAPGESTLLDMPVGEYLQPGIHSGPFGCEVWLQP